MIKRWLSYLLATVIACQSLLAVADSHDTQVDLPTINFVTSYGHTEGFRSDSSKAEIGQKYTASDHTDNCDHCGFCHHGHLIQPPLSLTSSLPITALVINQYHEVNPCKPASLLYRPPKA